MLHPARAQKLGAVSLCLCGRGGALYSLDIIRNSFYDVARAWSFGSCWLTDQSSIISIYTIYIYIYTPLYHTYFVYHLDLISYINKCFFFLDFVINIQPICMDLLVIFSSRVHLLVLERNDKTILKKGYYDMSTERTSIIDILKLSLPIAKAKNIQYTWKYK